jgi:ubiquinone/menaquinone biosynthesis C-methylase UbiE
VPAASLINGRIFALDIETDLIAETERKIHSAGLTNAIGERRDFLIEGSGRPDASVGYVMLFNILHIEQPVQLLREALRILRPGGIAGIIHWKHDASTPRGPSLAIRPTPEQCQQWALEAGFDFDRFESLCCCSWHFGLVVRKPNSF